ncbi:DUF2339 domain-containing protein [Marinobacter oulmenensis]|uniref:Putative membrane protein n=1 Tax=Marinobacter oulmenensis TaxID=643747 RepID=A0A840UBP4_9GAMM|nr:DUF2339 domain-containing protein [Marinobacter oulmenensis]MBB5321623.1 putative membrane protein [Marinobacter oulmenensis]
MEGIAVFAIVLFGIIIPGSILGWIAFFRQRELRDQIAALQAQLKEPDHDRVATRSQPLGQPANDSPSPETTVSAFQPEESPPPEHVPEPPQPAADKPVYAAYEPETTEADGAETETLADYAPWLAHMKENWMVWLGGVSVGLSGIFLVKYSIDAGLLGPTTRIALAILFGLAFHGVALWKRRQLEHYNDVLAALAGGASIILYAALLAALHLYHLWPAGLIFSLLLVVSLVTMGLSLIHGPVLAALGMLGAYVVPILVDTGSQNMLGALIYSLVITGSSLALLRYVYRNWLWLGIMAGAAGWWALSFTAPVEPSIQLIYLALVTYGFLAIPGSDWRLVNSQVKEEPPLMACCHQNMFASTLTRNFYTLVTFVAAAGLSIAVSQPSPVIALSILPALVLWVCRHHPGFSLIAWPTFAVTAIGILVSALASDTSVHVRHLSSGEATLFAGALAVLVGLFTPGALWNIKVSEHKGYWSSLAFLAPVVALSIAYIGLTDMDTHWQWAAAMLVLGAAYLSIANRQTAKEVPASVTAALVISAHLAYSLAAVMVLREATLTLALALQVVTLSRLHQRFALPVLPYLIKLVLGIVIVRLTMNPWLLSYPTDFHWSLWVCGGSALVVWVAAYFTRPDDPLRQWLQGASLHLLALTLIYETRYQLYDGDIFRHTYSYLEAALNMAAAGLVGNVYLYRARASHHLQKYYRVCGHLLLAVAGLTYVGALLLLKNPLWEPAAISSMPIFNSLLLAYGLPVVLAAISYFLLEGQLRKIAAASAGAALLYFVSIEIHHLWQGELSIHNVISDGEHYTYSMVWLLMSVAGTIAGIRFQTQRLYRAAMLLLMLVIAKIFLFDMSDVTGLWRVASFMGLGLCLLGLAYIHQIIRKNLQPAPTQLEGGLE